MLPTAKVYLTSMLALVMLAAGGYAQSEQPSSTPATAVQWTPGLVVHAGDPEATDTIQLVFGEAPGVYELPDVGARIKLGLFPSTAEEMRDLELTSLADQSHELRSKRIKDVRIEIRAAGRDTFLVEAASTAVRRAIFAAEVSDMDPETTTSIMLMTLEPTVLIEGPDRLRFVQLFANGGSKTSRAEDSILVAPVTKDAPVRLTISRRERRPEEFGIKPAATAP